MANANSDDENEYSDELEKSEESTNDGDSDDSNYDVKKSKNRRSKSKTKISKKTNTKTKKAKSKKKKRYEEDDDFSEGSLSQMSDVYPPSVATRRTRKTRTSSVDSNASDVRKTKSEPLLITLDSESDDQQSTSTNRPNRSARIQGEMIRKFGSMSHKIPSSVSVCNSKSRRKRLSDLKRHVHLKLKKNAKLYKGASQKRRLKIRSIHDRIARKGFKKLPENKEEKEEEEDEVSDDQPSPAPKKQGRPRKKSLQKDSELEDIEDDIRKIVNAPTPRPALVRKVRQSSEAIVDQSGDDAESDIPDDMDESNSPEDSRDQEALNEIESDLEKIKNRTVKEELEDSDYDSKKKSHKKSHKKKISNKPTTPGVRRRGRPRADSVKKKQEVYDTTAAEALALLNIKPDVPFLQNSFCFDVAPKLSKCRECRIAVYRNSKRMYNSYCRFMEYRKLLYTKQGYIQSAGFSNPGDATEEHLSQWLPNPKEPPKDLNKETAKSLLEHCGDQFCDLIEQEREAMSYHIGLKQKMTWKRIVQGVREMCDVCSTTIFNIHWVCPICGFAVCIDCYKVRKQGIIIEDDDEEDRRDRDEYKWLLCKKGSPHSQDSLIMAQMIPGKALWIMRDLLHTARDRCKIPYYCKCSRSKATVSNKQPSTGINKQLMSFVTPSFSTDKNSSFSLEKSSTKNDSNYDEYDVEVPSSALRWLNGSCINSDNINNNLKLSDDNIFIYEDFNILGENLFPKSFSQNVVQSDINSYSLDDIMSAINKKDIKEGDTAVVQDFTNRYPQPLSGRDPLPIRIYTKIESELLFPNVPHSWFCNGRLLFLHEANHKDNLSLFQEMWKRGQPIVVQGVDKGLDMDLWRPEGFCRDFGEVKNDLVDCKTGHILKNMPMKKFWEGFENFGKRLTDDDGEYMLLKLKDWPPGEDFSEKLPTRFEDLMKGLPLPEYTHRNGILNLAGRLPTSFVRPDLGPKMYNAYGSALFPQKGTTNLHLDISDAVNVMVYVGIPSDGKSEIHIHEALKAIDEGGCDSLMRLRVRNRSTKPGALWHIYNARDADKIRDMLTKVAIERGEKLEAQHDPIHDQSWYIDSELRLRLYRDYGVEGYAIAQCLGDAVFIPAGAPHQVRNLHSCVKVAEDFVSPENIGHCFSLTQEFRNLSDTHTNHEDKLQIKNIIYHVVRDSLSHLLPEDEPIGT